MTKVVAVAGAVFYAVGCLLGVIGLGSASWEVLPPQYLNINSTGTADDIIVSRGLWESCSIPRNTKGKGPCTLKALPFAEMGGKPIHVKSFHHCHTMRNAHYRYGSAIQ